MKKKKKSNGKLTLKNKTKKQSGSEVFRKELL